MERLNVLVTPPGTFGLAMCVPFLNNGHKVTAGFRDEAKAARFRQTYTDERLPGVQLPPTLKVTADLETAVREADLIVLATSSDHLREFYSERIMPFRRKDAFILNLVKGSELGTNLRPAEVVASLDPKVMRRYATMGGPNIALEIARGLPATTHIASRSMAVAQRISNTLFQDSPNRFRPYHVSDVVAVELVVAAKGAYAIGAGMSDGLEQGENARASFINRAEIEIARINRIEGGKRKTLTGPCMADLVLCCTSENSRNHQAGVELANGKTREQILKSGKTYEGFNAVKALVERAHRNGLRVPICEGIAAVSDGLVTVREALTELLKYDRFI